MKITSALLLGGLTLLASLASAQEPDRYKTGQIKVGDRILADAIGLGKPDTCTVIGTTELTGAYMPGYTNQYLIRCDHKAWTTVSATSKQVQPSGQANVMQNGQAAAQHPPAGANEFGTRNPRSCQPISGAMISPAQAAYLVTCAREQITGHRLYLVDGVRVSSITASRYDPHTQTGFTNMDVSVPPFAIRGALQSWSCGTVDANFSSTYNNFGKSCIRYNEKNAGGYCYKMRDGRWSCNMHDTGLSESDKQYNVGPPS